MCWSIKGGNKSPRIINQSISSVTMLGNNHGKIPDFCLKCVCLDIQQVYQKKFVFNISLRGNILSMDSLYFVKDKPIWLRLSFISCFLVVDTLLSRVSLSQ